MPTFMHAADAIICKAGDVGAIAESPLDVLQHVCHRLQAGGKALAEYAARAHQLGEPRAAYDVAQMALTTAEVSMRWREEGLPDPNTMSP